MNIRGVKLSIVGPFFFSDSDCFLMSIREELWRREKDMGNWEKVIRQVDQIADSDRPMKK